MATVISEIISPSQQLSLLSTSWQAGNERSPPADGPSSIPQHFVNSLASKSQLYGWATQLVRNQCIGWNRAAGLQDLVAWARSTDICWQAQMAAYNMPPPAWPAGFSYNRRGLLM